MEFIAACREAVLKLTKDVADIMRERDRYKAALELIACGNVPHCDHGYDCSCERIYAEQVLKQ